MNEAIEKILRDRYYLPTETSWEELAIRVSHLYEPITQDIIDMNFIPSSPTLMNYCLNNERLGTLSSCFPLKIEDSVEDIFQSVKDGALVSKYGGGCGWDFSSLRGSIENIKTLNAPSSGPVAFIKNFNSMLDTIRQGGKRRSAGMGMLDIDHPDILDFIDLKKNDGEIEYLNLSVRIPNIFYEQLKNDPKQPHMVYAKTENKYYPLKDKNGEVVSVKQIWDKIIDSSYNSAEPGLFNKDIATERCTVTNLDPHVLSNPCVVAGTKVLTPNGYKNVEDINEGDEIKVIQIRKDKTFGYNFGIVKTKYVHEDKEVVKVFFENNKTITVTPAHQFLCNDNEFKMVKDMDISKDEIWWEGPIPNKKLVGFHKIKIKKIIPQKEKQTVYDLFEGTTDTWITENFISRGCSEFTGISFQSCNLGSINLSNLVEGKKFNWEKFEDIIVKATRFLNNVIDKNNYPLDKIKDMTLKTRPMGLGFMALAHVLYKKEIPYNSEKAFKFTEEMSKYLTLRSMKESVELAKEYIEDEDIGQTGAYPAFDYDLFMKANERFFKHKHCRNIDIEQLKEDIKKYGVRNSCFTSIAPTGSISFIANVSSGVEPVFALSYSRKVVKQSKEKEYDIAYISDPVFDIYLTSNFDEKTKIKILKEVSENKGSCQKCLDIPEDMRKVFVVAGDLNTKGHLDILEATANSISLSVSKTLNFPENCKKEEIAEAFIDAYRRGIIGVTVYRENSKSGILIHDNADKPKIDNGRPTEIIYTHAPKRPSKLPCDIHRISVLGKNEQGEKVNEKWICFVGKLNEKPYEFFAGKVGDVNLSKHIEQGILTRVKSGVYAFEYEDEVLIGNICKTFDNSENETFARLVSGLLRQGMHPKYAIEQLHKCPGTIVDFSKAAIRMLKKYIEDGEAKEKCLTCGEPLRYESGCVVCSNPECGFSKC